jgi:hypothetical protein
MLKAFTAHAELALPLSESFGSRTRMHLTGKVWFMKVWTEARMYHSIVKRIATELLASKSEGTMRRF